MPDSLNGIGFNVIVESIAILDTDTDTVTDPVSIDVRSRSTPLQFEDQ